VVHPGKEECGATYPAALLSSSPNLSNL